MAKDAPKMVEARVLVDCAHGKINDVVTVTEEQVANSPELDDNPAAVAQAKKELAKAKAASGEVAE